MRRLVIQTRTKHKTMCSGNLCTRGTNTKHLKRLERHTTHNTQHNCSAKDFPRVDTKRLQMDALRGANMPHEPWGNKHTSACRNEASNINWGTQRMTTASDPNNTISRLRHASTSRKPQKKQNPTRIRAWHDIDPMTTNKNTTTHKENTR